MGVTDAHWYRFLAARPHLEEVNFWRPGGDRRFGALTTGEPFLFKTHHPHNQVVGGGFYSGFSPLRISEAWEYFGEGNGAESLQDMRTQVGRYRAKPIAPDEDPMIGCVFVRDTRFFAPDDVAGPPPDFQAKVLDAYSRRCSITGDKIRPVLQAAHIRPLLAGGEHRLDNGLLLRSDVHTLFDRGYLGVDPKYRLLVSRRLREEFGNGEQLYARAGQTITVPERRPDRPNPEFLEWHVDSVFQAS